MEKQLAFEYIKSRKKKNIIAIITIMLVTAFLTSICIYGYSYNKMITNGIVAFDGSHSGSLAAIKENDIDKIEKHANVESVGEVLSVGYEENKSEDIYYEYLDATALGYYDITVVEGIYPTKELEVAVDRLYSERFNKNVGDIVIINGKEFKIVGILDNLNYTIKDSKVFKVYMSKAYAESIGAEKSALIKLNNLDMYDTDFENIASLIGLSKDNITYNESMISMATGNYLEIMPYLLIGVLVALSAFFIIYNIFYIALGERMKSIGLLLTIGVTGKQVRKMVLYEAIFLSLIAIPFGTFIGVIFTKVLVEKLYVNGDLRFLVHPIILPVILILTLVTVLLSVMLPAIKVSRLSPIEASKFVPITKISKKKKVKKESKDFFKDFAKSNLNRNKKATRITRISLILSIVLFIISAAILNSMSIDNIAKSMFISNVQVDLEYMSLYEGKYISNEVIEKIKPIDKVNDVVGLKVIDIQKDSEKSGIAIGITEEIIKRAEDKIVEGSIDKDLFKSGEIAIVPQIHKSSSYKIGEYIEFEDGNGNIRKAKVAAIVSEPLVSIIGSPKQIYLYNDSVAFDNVNEFVKVLVDVKKEDCKIVSSKVEGITQNYKNLDKPQNYLDRYEALKEEKKGIETLGYIIVGVIALIGIMNFINSTLSGIMSRRKELGMLRAVGITDNEIKNILIKEGIYQIGVSLVTGITLGNILAAICVHIFKNFMGATFAIYNIPFIETLICIVVLVLVVIIITKVSINKITNDSIIEQIRFED